MEYASKCLFTRFVRPLGTSHPCSPPGIPSLLLVLLVLLSVNLLVACGSPNGDVSGYGASRDSSGVVAPRVRTAEVVVQKSVSTRAVAEPVSSRRPIRIGRNAYRGEGVVSSHCRQPARVILHRQARAVPNYYIVSFRQPEATTENVGSLIDSLTARYGLQIISRYENSTPLLGFSARFSRTVREQLRCEAVVAVIEQNIRGTVGPEPLINGTDQPFFAYQVDKQAVLITDGEELRLDAQGRKQSLRAVVGQFVVDTVGRPILSTLRLLGTNDRTLTAAVESALMKMQFSSAEKGGKKVRQVVQHRFVFSTKGEGTL